MLKLLHLASGFKLRLRWLAAASAVLVCSSSAVASLIVKYQTTSLGGDQWRYAYTLQGDGPAGGVDGVTIYFASAAYALLTNAVAPSDWDPLVVQPDTGLPADGFLDLLHLAGPLSGILTPVSFDLDFKYLGIGAPGAQRFELYNASPFSVVFSGQTESASVPEPSGSALVALALTLVILTPALGIRRRVAPTEWRGLAPPQ